MSDEAEDTIFAGDWIYCGAHLRPHTTGWCTVSNRAKVGLGITGKGHEKGVEAHRKCELLGLHLYRGDLSECQYTPGDVLESKDKRKSRKRRIKIIGRSVGGDWRAVQILGNRRTHRIVGRETVLSDNTLTLKWRRVGSY